MALEASGGTCRPVMVKALGAVNQYPRARLALKVLVWAGMAMACVALQLSVAVGAAYTTAAPQVPAAAVAAAGVAGQVITGGCVSLMVTVNVQLAGGVQPLVAVTVTVVTPILKLLPEPVPEPLAAVAPLKAYVSVMGAVPEAVAA